MMTIDIKDGNCQLFLSWTIEYQPVIRTRADLQARNGRALFVHKMYVEEDTISTFSTKTRGQRFNHTYWDPPDKGNTLWRNTGHRFIRLATRFHLKRVLMHLFAYKEMCCTLDVHQKGGSGTDSRYIYRVNWVVIQWKRNYECMQRRCKKHIIYIIKPLFSSLIRRLNPCKEPGKQSTPRWWLCTEKAHAKSVLRTKLLDLD